MRERYTCGSALCGIDLAACSNFIAAVARSLAEYALIPSSRTAFWDEGLKNSAAATPPITTTAISATNQMGCLLRFSTTTVSTAGGATATVGCGGIAEGEKCGGAP